jgi:hypothetical protein
MAELIKALVRGLAVMPVEKLAVAVMRILDAREKPNPDLQ